MRAHMFIFQVHESKGIKFITDAGVNGFKGENGKVRIFLPFDAILPLLSSSFSVLKSAVKMT